MIRLHTALVVATIALFVAGCGKTEQKEETADTAMEEVVFTETELYPEGIAYNPDEKVFYVTSLHYGVVGKVDWQGTYTRFAGTEDMPSAIGIEFDSARNRILVCVSDPGVSVHTVPEMQRKTAKLAIFDAATGERMYFVDLGALVEGAHFANDIALDPEGNAYVTDSFGPYIYKVTPDGQAQVFASDPRWAAEGFGLNGIVYHPDGFLIAGQATSGILYRVSVANPADVQPVASDNDFTNVDGMTLLFDNTLILVQNEQREITRVLTDDGWQSARKDATVLSTDSFPTTMAEADGELYVLNAKLNEIFNPDVPLSSEFRIQRVKFE